MRAQPGLCVMLCVAAGAVLIVAAAPSAQSREARVDAATLAAVSMLEQWLGPVPPSAQRINVKPAWPAAPLTMDVEARVAFEAARRYWTHRPPTLLMDGAARYLQSRVVAQIFDLAAGRSGNGIDRLSLFGDSYVHTFPNLRFDGPAAGLGRDDSTSPLTRAALAFASLERSIGQPRLIGALRSAIAAAPASDAELIGVLQAALGQEIAWLFEGVLDPSRTMNYRIAGIAAEDCAPAPCHRLRVDVAHDGEAAFRDLEVRVDFTDGQSASVMWNGLDRSRTVVFEGPSMPIRARLDPELVNLLDDNLLDQSREIGAQTNAPLAKWMARWTVWLQDAMLAYTALV